MNEDVVRTKGLALVLVLVLVLDEDVVLFMALALAQALLLFMFLVLYENVVLTQGHPRHYSRGAGGGVSNPLDRQRSGGSKQGFKDTGRGARQGGA